MSVKTFLKTHLNYGVDNKFQDKLREFFSTFSNIEKKKIIICDIQLNPKKPNLQTELIKAEIKKRFNELDNISVVNSYKLNNLSEAFEQNKLSFFKSLFKKQLKIEADLILMCNYYPNNKLHKQTAFDIQLIDIESAHIVKAFVWPKTRIDFSDMYSALYYKFFYEREKIEMNVLVNVQNETILMKKTPLILLQFLKAEIISVIVDNVSLIKNKTMLDPKHLRINVITDECDRYTLVKTVGKQKDVVDYKTLKKLLEKKVRYSFVLNVNTLSDKQISLELYNLESKENVCTKICNYNFHDNPIWK